jgi:hypothetical protein
MAAVTTRVPKLPGWMTLAEAADELKLTRSGVHKMKSILETIHFEQAGRVPGPDCGDCGDQAGPLEAGATEGGDSVIMVYEGAPPREPDNGGFYALAGSDAFKDSPAVAALLQRPVPLPRRGSGALELLPAMPVPAWGAATAFEKLMADWHNDDERRGAALALGEALHDFELQRAARPAPVLVSTRVITTVPVTGPQRVQQDPDPQTVPVSPAALPVSSPEPRATFWSWIRRLLCRQPRSTWRRHRPRRSRCPRDSSGTRRGRSRSGTCSCCASMATSWTASRDRRRSRCPAAGSRGPSQPAAALTRSPGTPMSMRCGPRTRARSTMSGSCLMAAGPASALILNTGGQKDRVSTSIRFLIE